MNKIFVILIILLFWSCTREQYTLENITDQLLVSERSSLPDVIEIFDLLKQPTNGYIYFTSSATLSTKNFRDQSIVVGGYAHDNNGFRRDFGTLKFDNALSLETDLSKDWLYESVGHAISKNLYGKNINISLDGKDELPGLNTTFKSPALLDVIFPVYSPNGLKIFSGQNFKWVPDNSNTNGIGVLIYYDPNDLLNKGIGVGYKTIINPVHTEDDGLYTITAQDLKDIPMGATVSVYLGRANYARVGMNNEYSIGIYAYSIIFHQFVVN